MPKRSFRSKVNKNNNSDSNNNNKQSINKERGVPKSTLVPGTVSMELQKAPLESDFGPNEMKRQIADAVRETSMRNKAKRDLQSRTNTGTLSNKMDNKNRGCGVGAANKSFLECFGVKGTKGTLGDMEISRMMDYSYVLRNSMVNKLDTNVNDQISFGISDKENNYGDVDCAKEWTSESAKVDYIEQQCDSSLPCYDKERSICKDNCNDSTTEGNKASISNILANIDPEILQELEMDDTTWEVISIGDWSQCGSDSEDQFYLISRDDASTVTTLDEEDYDQDLTTNNDDLNQQTPNNETQAVISSTNLQENNTSENRRNQGPNGGGNTKTVKNTKNSNMTSVLGTNTSSCNSNNNNGTNTTAKTLLRSDKSISGPPPTTTTMMSTLKRKKVVVTRKYIGSVDLEQKLFDLGFEEQEASGTEERKDDGKAPSKHWRGHYQQGQFEVESQQRCGLLVVSVKAECDSLLIGLTCLQGLIEDTGLLSYANFSLPSLLLEKRKAPVS